MPRWNSSSSSSSSGGGGGGGGGGGVRRLIRHFDSKIVITDVGTTAKVVTKLNGIEIMRLDTNGRMGLGTRIMNQKRLEINDPTGQTLRMIYNDSNGNPINYVDLCVGPTGNLLLDACGPDIVVGSNNSFDISGHDGLSVGLKLAGNLVTASASELNVLDGITVTTAQLNSIAGGPVFNGLTATVDELNYNDITTKGIAEACKSTVLDNSKNIIGINDLTATNLTATNLTGTITTADQPNITSLGSLSTLNVTGVINAGNLNVNNLSTLITTPNQPNITSVGTLTNLDICADNASTNTVIDVLQVSRTTSGTAANNIGVGIAFKSENSTGALVTSGAVRSTLTNVTPTVENSKMDFSVMNNGVSLIKATLDNTGNFSSTTISETSDKRMKENIVAVENKDSYDKIKQLEIFDYTFINDDNKRQHRGIMAQDLLKIIPSAVHIKNSSEIPDLHTVSNKELVGHLLSAVQYLMEKVEKLEKKE